MKKVISIITVLCLLMTSVIALAEGNSIVLTDMTGRTVELAAPAQKVVAITASNAEILCAVGGAETLVGRGEYCTYPAEILEIPTVKSGSELNLEEVIALEPDLIIMDQMAQTVEQVNQLTEAGIPVLMTCENGIEGIYQAIDLIGAAVGHQAEAAALVEEMRAGFDALASEAAALNPEMSVYFEVSSIQWGDPWTAGKGTFMDEVAQVLGLTNIFTDVDGWASVSVEEILNRNPGLIVTTDTWWGQGPTPVEEIMGREGWQDVDAVKNNAVYNADYSEMTIPGPRLLDGARNLLNFILELQEAKPAA